MRQGPGVFLALRDVTPLPMGELAAAAPPRLPRVSLAAIVVALPQEHRLHGVRGANQVTLTSRPRVTGWAWFGAT